MNLKNITIYDIAKDANVSPTTVSRVLTGSPLVKESTRQKVLAKMKELDFSPNEAARRLTKPQANLIGFILPEITNPFFSQIYMEVEKRAFEKGYTILLRNSMSNSNLESTHLREFTERRAACIVFMGGRINKTNPTDAEINEMQDVLTRVPIIMVNGKMKGVKSANIRTNEEEGIRSIVEHLVSLGHKKIGLIGGAKGIFPADNKIISFKRILKDYDLEFNQDWQIFSDFTVESGREAMKKLLENKSLPTAIIGINDLIIYGAYKECRDQNIPIEKFSFVGFDDIYPSDIVYPSLTTVNHNYDVLVNEVMRTIDSIVSGKGKGKGKIINTQLVIRESTKEL
ncbi:LacI family DNA-binding transcriptional regulator [Metabacillus halosaccharovorans]|uniref:LacI family DNA-binding transcriptional regulator n=1 Tax=Metabacillus halosaccharovorans TaxID=930124 RepID=UPI00203FAE8F|nr:LacI family DNA-binding transcriptional regulator [Metabacillus halosaccharovorans]MCM3443653.1 LacI family transcriptional regulator [Metabacillus halosaccharovorans]